MRPVPALRRPTYAGVAATLALVTSLSGSAYAAVMVTSADIKNDTIASRDLRNGSVRGVDVKNQSLTLADLSEAAVSQLRGQQGEQGLQGADGARGPQGPEGSTGEPGTTGPAGPAGESGPAEVQPVSTDSRTNGGGALVATCPADSYLVDGGGEATTFQRSSPVALSSIQPLDNDADGYLDSIRIESIRESSLTIELYATAWCAPLPTPPTP